jgi:hypothetical protein
MSVSDFIQFNISLSIPELMVKYYHLRKKKYPSDLDLWEKANELSQKDFCKWLEDKIYGR